MSDLYGPCHLQFQHAQGTAPLAALLDRTIVHDCLNEQDIGFIQSLDMFFLSTVDPQGRPTVSYKGGAPGFCRVEADEIVFPWYDGNGMFYSAGNLSAHPAVGLLFIDFATPNRLRVQGLACVQADASSWPGALFAVRVKPTHIFPNCGRYIHASSRAEPSRHVPGPDGRQPVAAWKRIDFLQEALAQPEVTAQGCITIEQYGALVARGES